MGEFIYENEIERTIVSMESLKGAIRPGDNKRSDFD